MLIKELNDQFITRNKIEARKRDSKYFKLGMKEIAFLISEAQQNIQLKLDVIIGTKAITLANGVNLYNCPSDFGKLKLATFGGYPITIESDYNLLSEQALTGAAMRCAVYTDGNTPQILVSPTPTESGTLNIYYSVDMNYYQPSNPTDQTWGDFSGSAFSGKLLLPDKYNKAVLLYMLAQIYDDIELKYDKEILSLRGNQASGSPLRLKYEFGQPKQTTYVPLGTGTTTTTGGTVSGSFGRIFQILAAQSGTSDPIITNTFLNALSATPVLARTGVGVYTITLAGAFTVGKTFLSKPNIDIAAVGDEASAELEHTSEDVITLRVFDTVYDPTDGFNAIWIKIEVEP